MSALPQAKFEFLSSDVRKRTGLVLGPEKAYLVDSRLGPLARKEGFAGVEALVDAMMRGDRPLAIAACEALATHETFFFRDKTPFELYEKTIAPALKSARAGRSLKIWCAAASSGQEPYSLAMLAEEGLTPPADILATDMSGAVLEKARAAGLLALGPRLADRQHGALGCHIAVLLFNSLLFKTVFFASMLRLFLI